MKKIFLTAAMIAMTMGAFAQSQVAEQVGNETTTTSSSDYLKYTNSQLMEIMDKAIDLAHDGGYSSFKLYQLYNALEYTNENDREDVLDTYEIFKKYIPTYLVEAEEKAFFSGASGSF